jgi:hypothetical protein
MVRLLLSLGLLMLVLGVSGVRGREWRLGVVGVPEVVVGRRTTYLPYLGKCQVHNTILPSSLSPPIPYLFYYLTPPVLFTLAIMKRKTTLYAFFYLPKPKNSAVLAQAMDVGDWVDLLAVCLLLSWQVVLTRLRTY